MRCENIFFLYLYIQQPYTMKDNHNYCLILAGGVGSRLWPVSRTGKPKQFMDILGTGRTLLQQTYDRVSRIFPADNIYISTNVFFLYCKCC